MKKVPLSGGNPPPREKLFEKNLSRWMSARRCCKGRCKLQAPLKGGNFGAKLTLLCGFWLDVSFLLHMNWKTSFAILIGRIIFFFAFRTKKLLKWKSLVFHCCLYNQYNITYGPLEIRNFSSRVEKIYFSQSLGSPVKYFSTLEEKFSISASPCNIPYLRHILLVSISQYVYNKLTG